MLPRLTAEESLLTQTRVGMGTGAFEEADARAIFERWTRQMNGGERPRAAKATPQVLAGMGIKVVGRG